MSTFAGKEQNILTHPTSFPRSLITSAQTPNHARKKQDAQDGHQPNGRDKRRGKQSKPGNQRWGRALFFAVDNAPAADSSPQQRSVQKGRVKHTPIMAEIARLVRRGAFYGDALSPFGVLFGADTARRIR